MIKLFNWFSEMSAKRKLKTKRKVFEDGFNWVMSEYYLNDNYLENLSAWVNNPIDPTEFDAGGRKALRIIFDETGHCKGFYRNNKK